MKVKKLTALILSGLTAFSLTACGNNTSDDGKVPDWAKNATQIHVQNFPGGIGRKWLDEAAERFQETNKDTSFETGKKGVYIDVSNTQADSSTLTSSGYQIIFDERYSDIYELAQSQSILPLDDIMTEVGADGVTLESKIREGAREGLKGSDGKYYSLPHYEWFPGLIYDKDAFDNHNWYIAKEETGNVADTDYGTLYLVEDENTDKSCGPDGVYGTEDDGLPSSLEEMIILAKFIKDDVNMAAFTVSGKYLYYTNYLVEGLWASLAGYDELQTVYSLDGEVEVVTGYTNENLFTGIDYVKKPITEKTTITKANGYLAYRSAARYYATAFIRIMMNEGFFASEVSSQDQHTAVQKKFIDGGLDDRNHKPRAFLLEGSYWYNESVDVDNFGEYNKKKSDDAGEREVRYMRLPVLVNGSVEAKADGAEADKATLLDNGIAYAYINANIKNNTDLVNACKAFLKFLYSDAELRAFTALTGITRPINYTLSETELNGLSSYQQDVYNLSRKANIVYYGSGDQEIKRIQNALKIHFSSPSITPTFGSTKYSSYYAAYKAGKTVEEVFANTGISESTWTLS